MYLILFDDGLFVNCNEVDGGEWVDGYEVGKLLGRWFVD